MVFAFVVGEVGGHVMQAAKSFVSGVAGPLLGVFILGSWFPWANKFVSCSTVYWSLRLSCISYQFLSVFLRCVYLSIKMKLEML